MNVNCFNKKYNFDLDCPSYIGRPINNSFMFVTKKVEHLISNLEGINCCLVFAENGMLVEEKYMTNNCFVFSDNPQLSYTKFALLFKKERDDKNKERTYKVLNGSYIGFTKIESRRDIMLKSIKIKNFRSLKNFEMEFNNGLNVIIGENVSIGSNCLIESGCFIDHDVVIGDNCTILANSIIRNSIIGNNVLINENALIGSNGFNMTTDEYGNKLRIPTLGRVVIKDNVEVGAFDNISSGIAGETFIDEYVKLDAHVNIGHDVILHKNVEITSGCVLGGFTEICENAFLGLRSITKNRVVIGKNSFVGMGSVVMRNVDDNVSVLGNPARPLPQERK